MYLRLIVELLAKIKRDANVTDVIRVRAGINLWNAPVSPAAFNSREISALRSVVQASAITAHKLTLAKNH